MIITPQFQSIGEAWIKLLKMVYMNGKILNDELKEIPNCSFVIKNIDINDVILTRYSDKEHILEMKHVFQDNVDNKFKHSYAHLIRGPKGKSDLSDVIDLLLRNNFSKRATVVFIPDNENEKVPCIQCIHFILRDGKLETTYFARSQDIYSKFYADIIAINDFSLKIAKNLKLKTSQLCGFVSSLHIYNQNMENVRQLLSELEFSRAFAREL